jgi:hypothetical protein
MRSFLIIGAGQAGLQLGIGLLRQGYKVTLISDKTANDFLRGPIFSTQGLFSIALENERALNLNFYESDCPKNTSIHFKLLSSPHPITFQGEMQPFFQAVDQRLKFSRWLDHFVALGGDLLIKKITLSELESLAPKYDLTLIASGKGELGQLFKRNEVESIYDKPQRALAAQYLQGMQPMQPYGMRATIIPGVGEYFTMSGLTLNGYCEMLLFEGISDGEFDCWQNILTAEEQLAQSRLLLEKYVPADAERYKSATLTDDKAVLRGSYTPVVRHPIAHLPHSGKAVLGIGDAVVLNDPVAGQGANNASKAANIYLNGIIEHGSAPFDEDWMQMVFDRYWYYAKAATQLSNMLLEPMPAHIITFLLAAMNNQAIANKLANGFRDPTTLFPWILDIALTNDIITSLA